MNPEMTDREKARIILESLEEYLQIDWNFEKYYLMGIERGLRRIEGKDIGRW
jgi:hypothetical protein